MFVFKIVTTVCLSTLLGIFTITLFKYSDKKTLYIPMIIAVTQLMALICIWV